MANPRNTSKKAAGLVITVILLAAMLVISSFALFTSRASVSDNQFETGTVKIALNGGQAVFDGSDTNIEPGHSLKRDFTVENQGTADIYYRLYLENVSGTLQEALIVEIYDGDTLLFSGLASELTKDSPCQGETPLKAGETRTLTAVVKMQESAGNAFQAGEITFDITADAVQARNNPDKAFA